MWNWAAHFHNKNVIKHWYFGYRFWAYFHILAKNHTDNTFIVSHCALPSISIIFPNRSRQGVGNIVAAHTYSINYLCKYKHETAKAEAKSLYRCVNWGRYDNATSHARLKSVCKLLQFVISLVESAKSRLRLQFIGWKFAAYNDTLLAPCLLCTIMIVRANYAMR